MIIEYSSQLELTILELLTLFTSLTWNKFVIAWCWQHHSDLTDFSKVCWEVMGVDFIYNSSTDSVNPECQLSATTIRLLGEFSIINEEIKSFLQLKPKERNKTSRLSGKEKSITTHQKIQKIILPEWQGLNLSFLHSTLKVSLSSYSHFWGERLSCQELFFTLLENVLLNWQENHFVRRLQNTSTQCLKLKACFYFKLISISLSQNVPM